MNKVTITGTDGAVHIIDAMPSNEAFDFFLQFFLGKIGIVPRDPNVPWDKIAQIEVGPTDESAAGQTGSAA